jgi:hypothetical protein
VRMHDPGAERDEEWEGQWQMVKGKW